MRRGVVLATLMAQVVLASSALADPATLRIESRPYTSATVTLEQGVRVWRPLPATDRVIITPGNKARVHVHVGGDQLGAAQPIFAPPGPAASGLPVEHQYFSSIENSIAARPAPLMQHQRLGGSRR